MSERPMGHSKPLLIELFAGLHGWGEGAVAEGFRVVGFDIFDMCRETGMPRPAGDIQLVLQDVLTLHGSQFKDAALIVASPPCQAYSYRAMPWKRAKALPPPDNSLFDACFRIQREACEAAGRHIPLVAENVRGAQKWVGRSRWNFGSFHLWGDVPALMPMTMKRGQKMPEGAGVRTDKGRSAALANYDELGRGLKNNGGSWFNIGSPGQKETGRNPVHEGCEQGGDWFSTEGSISRTTGGYSKARKAASAHIAKIPFALSSYIARTYAP